MSAPSKLRQAVRAGHGVRVWPNPDTKGAPATFGPAIAETVHNGHVVLRSCGRYLTLKLTEIDYVERVAAVEPTR